MLVRSALVDRSVANDGDRDIYIRADKEMSTYLNVFLSRSEGTTSGEIATLVIRHWSWQESAALVMLVA